MKNISKNLIISIAIWNLPQEIIKENLPFLDITFTLLGGKTKTDLFISSLLCLVKQ